MTQGLHTHLPWRAATVKSVRAETAKAFSIVLDVPGWTGHLAGQHLDLRLTSADGYQAQRSYSIASPSGGTTLEVTVEEVENGEVSPFLVRELMQGDILELRGPIGGYFTWRPGTGRPLLLIAGGSGITPLMAMLRERALARDRTPARLLYSARNAAAIIYRHRLDGLAARQDGFSLVYTLTREPDSGWAGERRRIDRRMIETHGLPPQSQPDAYVCGPTAMVEQAADQLLALGHAAASIRTERFGPSGDTR